MTRVLHCPMFKTRAIADIERRERLSPVRAILGSECVRVRITEARVGKAPEGGASPWRSHTGGQRQGQAKRRGVMCEQQASLRVRGGESRTQSHQHS